MFYTCNNNFLFILQSKKYFYTQCKRYAFGRQSKKKGITKTTADHITWCIRKHNRENKDRVIGGNIYDITKANIKIRLAK